MEDLSVELTPAMLALVPTVGWILQILKRIDAIKKLKQYNPLFGAIIAFGIIQAMGATSGIADPILASIFIGLATSKSYDIIKKPE